MLGVDFNVDKSLREETGGVSVEEVFNSYNLAESPRPASNIKAHVWSPQQLPGEKKLQYSNEISEKCSKFSRGPSNIERRSFWTFLVIERERSNHFPDEYFPSDDSDVDFSVCISDDTARLI